MHQLTAALPLAREHESIDLNGVVRLLFTLGDLTWSLNGAAMPLGVLDEWPYILLATSALIIPYLTRESAADTPMAAGALLVALGVGGIIDALFGSSLQGSLPIIGAGWLLVLTTSLWSVYRLTKGWVWLREGERL